MTTRPDSVATPQSRRPTDRPSARTIAATTHAWQVSLLQARIVALERTLEAEQERREAIVTRYERLLTEQ
jgi:hypothetical protein